MGPGVCVLYSRPLSSEIPGPRAPPHQIPGPRGIQLLHTCLPLPEPRLTKAGWGGAGRSCLPAFQPRTHPIPHPAEKGLGP